MAVTEEASGSAEATFPAQPASVGGARRLVRAALSGSTDVVDPLLLDDALLVVSELVGNAVLHGAGPIVVRVATSAGPRLRLEVADASAVAPALRGYDPSASTGRGLGLVARMATHWGVDAVDSGGKVVWAELAAGPGSGSTDLEPFHVDGALVTGPPPGPDGAAVVRFVGVPVALYLRLQEQNDAVLRELELLAFAADHEGDVDPSPELAEVIERSRRYFNVQREGFRRDVGSAAARGEATIDLSAPYLPAALRPSAEYIELFERAEELAADDQMLVGPADLPVARLRRWFVSEMSRQLLDGAEPRPFSEDEDLPLPG